MFRSWQTEYDTRRWSRIDKFVLHPKFIEYNKVGNADFEKSKGNFGKAIESGENTYILPSEQMASNCETCVCLHLVGEKQLINVLAF